MPVAWNKYFLFWWTNNICGCKCSSVAVKREGFHAISCHPHQYNLHIRKSVLETTLCMIWFKIYHRSQIPNLYSTWSWVWEKRSIVQIQVLKISQIIKVYITWENNLQCQCFTFPFWAVCTIVNFPTVANFWFAHVLREVRLRISPSAGNKMLGKLVGWRPRMKAKLSTKKKFI